MNKQPVKHAPGNWQVIRNCCTSGMCITCLHKPTRPIRIVQADNYSEEYAKYVADNWTSYKAVAVPMGEQP